MKRAKLLARTKLSRAKEKRITPIRQPSNRSRQLVLSVDALHPHFEFARGFFANGVVSLIYFHFLSIICALCRTGFHRCQHGLRKMRDSARNDISRTHANFACAHKCEQNTTYPYTLSHFIKCRLFANNTFNC